MLRSDLPISLPYSTTASTKFESGFTLTEIITAPAASLADLAIFDIPFKCEIFEVGILILTGLGGSNPGPIDFRFDVRKTAGSNTGRGDGDAGIVYLYETGASAAGEYCYDLAGQELWSATGGASLLEPGMQVIFQTGATYLQSTAAMNGKIKPFLLVKHLPEVRDNLVNAQETT